MTETENLHLPPSHPLPRSHMTGVVAWSLVGFFVFEKVGSGLELQEKEEGLRKYHPSFLPLTVCTPCLTPFQHLFPIFSSSFCTPLSTFPAHMPFCLSCLLSPFLPPLYSFCLYLPCLALPSRTFQPALQPTTASYLCLHTASHCFPPLLPTCARLSTIVPRFVLHLPHGTLLRAGISPSARVATTTGSGTPLLARRSYNSAPSLDGALSTSLLLLRRYFAFHAPSPERSPTYLHTKTRFSPAQHFLFAGGRFAARWHHHDD